MSIEALIGGVAVGAAAGAWMSRSTVCFNAGLRRAGFGADPSILRIFAIAVALQLLLLPLLVVAGIEPFEDSGALPAIGLFPVAQLAGGLLFGAGMALAGGCIAGILWKSGAGSVATAIAIVGFVTGELLIRGPFEGVLADLDGATARPSEQTLYDLVGVGFAPLALLAGVVLAVALWRGGSQGVRAGVGLGLIAVAAWIAAGWAGYGYGLGFVGAADNAREAVAAGDAGLLGFAFFLAAGVIAGAALAVRGPLRMPDGRRSLRAAAGGLAMGIGGSIAHGCNIGNGLTGIPLLSLGSALATAAMAAGALVTWRLVFERRPELRGRERPQPDW